MSDTAEKVYTMLALDRARKRWRWVALAAIVAVAFMVVSKMDRTVAPATAEAHVAMVELTGFLSDTPYQLSVLADIADDPAAKALFVHIDSPGGTMVGGLNLYHALRRVAETKPVVVNMGTVAASAGYLVALGGDHIVASEATLTGSIGVFMPLIDATGLADKIGVTADTITSGDKKTITSPLQQRTPDDIAYLTDMVNDLEEVFITYITSRRDVSANTITLVRDGRTVIGKRAHELGLVDAVGDPATARAWLADTHGIGLDVPHVSYSLEEPHNWLQQVLSQSRAALGSLWQASRPTPAVWAIQP